MNAGEETLRGLLLRRLAGAIGALVYCLHCPELAAPFLGFWYLLGMLIPTAAGGAARSGAEPGARSGRRRFRGTGGQAGGIA